MKQLALPSPMPGQPRRPQIELIEPATSVVAGAFVESFRLLALNIRRALSDEARRVIVLMSAHPGDGRSLCAASLAQALSLLAPPVILIDGDPLGAGLSPLQPSPALALEAAAPRSGAQHDAQSARLRVFRPTHRLDHSALVDEVESAVARIADQATVIIDTPPCTISSLGFHLAASATGVLYVARRRAQDSAIHREIRGQLNLLGIPVFGVVFNEG
jgi:Mrp family chromosome partitioning ATPase